MTTDADDILAEPGTRPFPGSELTVRVAGDPYPESFFEYGRRSIEDNVNALAAIGRSFTDYRSILDFGCGCGRMLTWLEPLAKRQIKLHGTDTDADAVAWVRENLPFASADVNEPLPPTAYEDGQFDLVYNHSVFTHLDEERQDAWLFELRRITRPGGHLLLTVHGEHAFSRYEDAMVNNGGDAIAERETYASEGFWFMRDEGWQEKGFPEWYGGAYHTTAYVLSHWSRWFRIKAYLPQGALNFQDIVVLARVDDGDHHGEYLRQPASVLRAIAAARAAVAADAAGAPEDAGAPDAAAPEDVATPEDVAAADATAAANDEARARAQAALTRAERLLASGPDTASRSRLGPLGTLWRHVLARLIANYSGHERQVDQALIEALRAEIDSRRS